MEESASDMAERLGIAPGASVDDRQRFELLRSWHTEQGTADVETDDDPELPPKL